jgi:hypothetical protein
MMPGKNLWHCSLVKINEYESRATGGSTVFLRVHKEIQARNSVGECYLDMVEVGGSIPPVPTNFFYITVA